jgi:hypothetical protein
MATLPLLSMHGSYATPQPRFEAEVRRLLRRAGDPFFLATSPLAQALCHATGIPNAKQALIRTIDGAFAQRSGESRLCALLHAPVEGMPETELPDALRVSRRHLLRRRAKAVTILAAHIRHIVGRSTLATAPEEPGRPVQPLDAIGELFSLAVRERVEMGAFDERFSDLERYVDPALYEVFAAQARQIAGLEAGAGAQSRLAFAVAGAGTAETRFELESLALMRARHTGDARAFEAVARNLRRLAGERPAWVLRALLAQAESSLRRGRLQEANALLDAIDRKGAASFAAIELVCASMLRAELALAQGDDVLAESFASAAYLVLRGRNFNAYKCQTIVARARLRLGASWTAPSDAGALAAPAWDRIALDVELARHLAMAGDAARARSIARDSFRVASDCGYVTLAARAAATIGALHGGKERRTWYLRALALALPARDRSGVLDLFALEGAPLAATLKLATAPADFIDLLYQSLIVGIPPARGDGASEAQAGYAFLKALVAGLLEASARPWDPAEAAATLAKEAPAVARTLAYYSASASELIGTVMHAVVGLGERSKVQYRLDDALHEIERHPNSRANPLRFLVG